MSTSNSDSSCPTLTLLHSAFGPNSTLYTVLQCNKSSTSAELKRAYRKAALRYHPDRCNQPDNEASSASSITTTSASTLKFQAVSAAYQIVMDERRKSVYDDTGQIVEEDDWSSFGFAHNGKDSSASDCPPFSTNHHEQHPSSQRQWEQFFQSIFHELISTGSQHATSASTYRGSDAEIKDVLHYFQMCKGNMTKVAECIVHGSVDDVDRWKRDIVKPAVARGEVDDFIFGEKKNAVHSMKKQRRTILEDSSSSSDEEIGKATSSNGRRRLDKRKGGQQPKHNSFLVDTDDEEEDAKHSSPQMKLPSLSTSSITNNSTKISSSMSKRDKMDYRVAKKRKAKAKKEMEMADIIQSKNWGSTADNKRSPRYQRPKGNMGGISDALLSNIEKKYGGNKKKGRKR